MSFALNSLPTKSGFLDFTDIDKVAIASSFESGFFLSVLYRLTETSSN